MIIRSTDRPVLTQSAAKALFGENFLDRFPPQLKYNARPGYEDETGIFLLDGLVRLFVSGEIMGMRRRWEADQ